MESVRTLPPLIPETGTLDCLVDRVVDGDTLDCLLFIPVRVRVIGMQAAETSTVKGKLVKKTVADRLTKQICTLTMHKKDQYGRALADVQMPDGKDLAQWLIAQELAVPWNGTGPRPVGSEVVI
jgi:endonuclease YncB( thermonuclease family)